MQSHLVVFDSKYRGGGPSAANGPSRIGQISAAVSLTIISLFAAVVLLPPSAFADPPGISYLGPSSLVASSDGSQLYVACEDSRTVIWVDSMRGEVQRKIEVPLRPTGIALSPDRSLLAITCAAPSSQVLLVSSQSGEIKQTLASGHTAISPVFSPDGQRLYVCNRFDNNLSVFDLAAGKEITRLPALREPVACAVTPDGSRVLVADHLPATRADFDFNGDVSPLVAVFDTSSWAKTVVSLPHGANSIRRMCIAPDGRYALVTHLLSNFQMVPFRVDTGWIDVNVVSVIDLAAGKVVRTIGLDEYDQGAGNPWDVVFASDGKYVCVSLAGTHELAFIETSVLMSDLARRTMQPMMGAWPIYTSLGQSFWRRLALPGKGPRGLAVAGSRVYCAEYFSDTVSVVEIPAGEDSHPRGIALGPPPQLTVERRGEMLFHDATICYQHWVSCSSCHPDGRADSLNWDLMNDGVGNPKNTKSMLLTHKTPPAMAEGVRMSAEEAVRAGIEHVLFTHRPEPEAAAMDCYLKSLSPVPSPYLQDGQFSEAAIRGRELFEGQRAGCYRCHPAPLYTDLKSHNVGSKNRHEYSERFDTPSLVEAWRTAPYMHDGRYVTIRDLLVEGQHGLKNEHGEPLSPQEIEDLATYVMSL
jgi:YVTN family beta-propeller protein